MSEPVLMKQVERMAILQITIKALESKKKRYR